MPVKPIPEGYHTVTPLLSVKGADRLIDFMKKAFGATEIYTSRTIFYHACRIVYP